MEEEACPRFFVFLVLEEPVPIPIGEEELLTWSRGEERGGRVVVVVEEEEEEEEREEEEGGREEEGV